MKPRLMVVSELAKRIASRIGGDNRKRSGPCTNGHLLSYSPGGPVGDVWE